MGDSFQRNHGERLVRRWTTVKVMMVSQMEDDERTHCVTVPISHVSGIILAGGGGRRMGGINKGLLEVGGYRIIDRVARALCPVFRHVMVITNSPEEYRFLGLPLHPDLLPGRGPLGGLYTGLTLCESTFGFLTACDMPFLNSLVIHAMVNAVRSGDSVIVPRIRGRLHPLHAIYSRSCLPFIKELLEQDDLKIINLFSMVAIKEIPESEFVALDPTLRFVMNLNTPEDVAKARQIVKSQDQAISLPQPYQQSSRDE